MSIPRQLVTFSLLTLLRLPSANGGTGWLIGDGQAPVWPSNRAQPDPKLDYPYGILYSLDGGSRDGDFVDDESDSELAYQVTVVGRRRDQAELANDRLCKVIAGKDPSGAYLSTLVNPTGLAIIRRSLDLPAGVEKQGTVQQAVWVAAQRFRLTVTPA